jgi:predicted GNAT family acetyltransferase
MNQSQEELAIRHAETGTRGAFYIQMDGERVAEQTYARLGPNRIVIDHTAVGAKLQGRGIARRLLDGLVAWARGTGTRVSATCSYSKGQFQKDASIRDVYDP